MEDEAFLRENFHATLEFEGVEVQSVADGSSGYILEVFKSGAAGYAFMQFAASDLIQAVHEILLPDSGTLTLYFSNR